ncbi:MAG: DUF308 domain-containing protein [Candidatus Actinomarina sp.]|nr:DUF308 domain-containing protein [Candidatus Actinomarina sp.]
METNMNDTHETPASSGPQESVPTRAHRTSWNIVVDGILLVLLAAVVILNPEKTETAFIWFIGILSLAGGAVLFARIWMVSRLRTLHPMYWGVALVPIAVGLILLIWPLTALSIMVYTVAITLLVRGVVECTLATSNKERPGWEFLLLHGILGIALGILFFVWPTLAPVLLILFLGVDLIVRGANQVSYTTQIKKHLKDANQP